MAYNRNKVIDLYYADKIYASEDVLVPDYEVGKSYDMIYGPQSLGINPLTGYPVFLVKDNKEKQASETLTVDDVVALGLSLIHILREGRTTGQIGPCNNPAISALAKRETDL